MSNSFFSRNNIHTSIWAIIVALLGFGGGLVWKHFFSEPEKVFVTNDLNKKDTLINIVRVIGDTSIYNRIKKLEGLSP